jgi:glyceraldehyde 3-phosphate dehydrogenase
VLRPDQPAGLRLGLHGFGRIGRAVLRASLDTPHRVVAVNDSFPDDDNLLYLLRHDSLYGRLPVPATARSGWWDVGDASIRRSRATRLDEVDWSGTDVVIDATGASGRAEWDDALAAGAATIVLTRYDPEADLGVVVGVNDAAVDPVRHRVIAAGTCDGNALALVLHALRALELRGGSVLTLHPWLGYQNVLDGPVGAAFPADRHGDYALGRAATMSLIPKATSVLASLSAVMPAQAEMLSAMSYRVPTPSVSSLVLMAQFGLEVPSETVNALLAQAAAASGEAMRYSDSALVSVDFRDSREGVAVDGRWTDAAPPPRLTRVVAWYDNETGYAHQVLRIVSALALQRSGLR